MNRKDTNVILTIARDAVSEDIEKTQDLDAWEAKYAPDGDPSLQPLEVKALTEARDHVQSALDILLKLESK